MTPEAIRSLLDAHVRVVCGSGTRPLDATDEQPNWQQRDVLLAWQVLGLYTDYCHGALGDPANVRLLPPPGVTDHVALFARFAEGMGDLRDSLNLGTEYLQWLWAYWAKDDASRSTQNDLIAAFARAMSGREGFSRSHRTAFHTLAGDYLGRLLCSGRTDLTAVARVHLVPGRLAAWDLLLRTLTHNRLLKPGDKVACFGPYPPFLHERLTRYHACEWVPVPLDPQATLQPAAWEPLLDPELKLLLNPSPANPLSLPYPDILPAGLLADLALARPDLLMIHDLSECEIAEQPPQRWPEECWVNSLFVYSPAHAYGLAEQAPTALVIPADTVADALLRRLPTRTRQALAGRYGGRLWDPVKAGFSDRVGAEGAGVSGPDEVLFCLCAAYSPLHDEAARTYFACVRKELEKRGRALYSGLGVAAPAQPSSNHTHYRVFLDLSQIIPAPEFAPLATRDIWDFVFHLAHAEQILLHPGLLSGGGPWTISLSLASLSEKACQQVGESLRRALSELAGGAPCPLCTQLWETDQ
jgi:hypothetical protein